jgi:hypothetical protein
MDLVLFWLLLSLFLLIKKHTKKLMKLENYKMELFVTAVFIIMIIGLGIVFKDSINHSNLKA